MLWMTKGPSAFEIATEWEDHEQSLTASMGFSFANLEILATSSFRFSGGKMLSIHAEPWFNMPLTEPWRPPAMPLIASAMSAENVWAGEGRFGTEDVLFERERGQWWKQFDWRRTALGEGWRWKRVFWTVDSFCCCSCRPKPGFWDARDNWLVSYVMRHAFRGHIGISPPVTMEISNSWWSNYIHQPISWANIY